jgi:hypothetical protein
MRDSPCPCQQQDSSTLLRVARGEEARNVVLGFSLVRWAEWHDPEGSHYVGVWVSTFDPCDLTNGIATPRQVVARNDTRELTARFQKVALH